MEEIIREAVRIGHDAKLSALPRAPKENRQLMELINQNGFSRDKVNQIRVFIAYYRGYDGKSSE